MDMDTIVRMCRGTKPKSKRFTGPQTLVAFHSIAKVSLFTRVAAPDQPLPSRSEMRLRKYTQ